MSRDADGLDDGIVDHCASKHPRLDVARPSRGASQGGDTDAAVQTAAASVTHGSSRADEVLALAKKWHAEGKCPSGRLFDNITKSIDTVDKCNTGGSDTRRAVM